MGCYLPKIPETDDYGLDYMRNNPIKFIRKEGYLDLFLFAPTNGHCPHCKSNKIVGRGVSSWLKLVLKADDFPMYCRGMDIKCVDCNSFIKSMDSRYVNTLPSKEKLQMTFLNTGQSYGIDNAMVRGMRNGQTASSISANAKAAIQLKHGILRRLYEEKAKTIINSTFYSYETFEPFPPLPESWFAASYLIITAFLRDYQILRPELYREIQTVRSSSSMSADHQRKVVKRVKKNKDQELGMGSQTYIVNGDRGVVHNYVVVPDTAGEWTHLALDEIYHRHLNENGEYEGPRILFVDCGCCNGKLKDPNAKQNEKQQNEKHTEEETPKNPNANQKDTREETPKDPNAKQNKEDTGKEMPVDSNLLIYKNVIELKLDGIHVIFRITRETNSEHPRARSFARHISRAIYIVCQVCEKNLQNARRRLKCALTEIEKKRDAFKYGRRTPGPGILVAKRLLLVLMGHIQIDKEVRKRFETAGKQVDNINSADPAYPLITRKVRKVILQQVTHCLNGCLDSEGKLAHIETGIANYRNTGIMLKTYDSPFGSSRCETFHSVAERYFANYRNISFLLFDARACWKVIHYNRRKLKPFVDNSIPEGLAPSEYYDAKIIAEGSVKPMYFGFDYCRKVLQMANDKIHDEAIADIAEHNITDLGEMSDKELKILLEPEDLEPEDSHLELKYPTLDNPLVNVIEDDLADKRPSNSNDVDRKLESTLNCEEESRHSVIEMLHQASSKDTVEPPPIAANVVEMKDTEMEETKTVDFEAFSAATAITLLNKSNSSASWANDIVENIAVSGGCNSKRHIWRRRTLGGNVTYYQPDYNEAMLAEWNRIFIKHTAHVQSSNRKVTKEMVQEYAALQVQDSQKKDP